MSQPSKTNSQGFTLLEILLVVGIVAVLAGIVIIAINPTRQLQSVRDVQRKGDIAEVNKAMIQFYIDNGYYPASTTLSTTPLEVCNTGTATAEEASVIDCSGLVNLSELVPRYIVAIPADPFTTDDDLGVNYKVAKTEIPPKLYVEATLTELNGGGPDENGDELVAYVGPIPNDSYTIPTVSASGY